jgi:hypothetical protein
MYSCRYTKLVLILLLILNPGVLGAGEINLVRAFETWNGGIIMSTDPAGIAYHPPSDHLFISDSEINEITAIWNSENVFETSLAGDDVFNTFDAVPPTGPREPTGITYNSFDGFFYITHDGQKLIMRYDSTFASVLGSVVITNDVPSAKDPEGITSDPSTGNLYVADGNGGGRQVLVYTSDFVFVDSFSVVGIVSDPEGIAYSSVSNHLFIVSSPDEKIFEYTLDGSFVDEYDISGFTPAPINPQGLTFAPSSDTTDNPNSLNLYIADGQVDNNQNPNERDGIVYEAHISFPPAPIVSDIPDQSILEGQSFAAISLDDFVDDPDHTDAQMAWTYAGNTDLTVNVDVNRVATITTPDSDWTGSETITFTATDPTFLFGSDDATFTVISIEPDIVVNPTNLNFGLTLVNDSSDLPFTITNIGATILTVSDVSTTNGAFTVVSPSTPFDVAAGGGSQDVTIRFSPSSEGVHTGNVEISSNDPDEAVATISLTGEGGTPKTIHIPGDYLTIQEGIDSASNIDTVLVAPGVYQENLILNGKNIVLGSLFLTTADTSYIGQTIIDGNGGTVIQVSNTVESMIITGFTIQNGNNADGILATSRFQLLNNHIRNCNDGIDYKGGGGICRGNLIENSLDAAIDLDDGVDIVIENNTLLNNQEDGIEARLQTYSGPTVTVIIRWNTIHNNAADGIQLIDDGTVSNRVFIIERNLVYDNGAAGLGLMGNGNGTETFEGASITDLITLTNNIFDNNNHGITGGDNMTAMNNIVMNSTVLGMKNVDGNSLISYTDFWQNGTDLQNCNVDAGSIMFVDPLLNPDYALQALSPMIDAGYPGCTDPDSTVCDIGVFYFPHTPLPIQLAGLTAVVVNQNEVRVDWMTLTETNNYGFELQKSAADTTNDYQTLPNSFIPGHGTTVQPNSYSYTDMTASSGRWFYRLKQIDLDGTTHYTEGVQVDVTTSVNEKPVPTEFALEQNYPNPFNPSTQIQFALPKATHVMLEIYSALGELITALVDETRQAGYYSEQFDATGLASGLYFYRLQSGDFVDTKKLLLLK